MRMFPEGKHSLAMSAMTEFINTELKNVDAAGLVVLVLETGLPAFWETILEFRTQFAASRWQHRGTSADEFRFVVGVHDGFILLEAWEEGEERVVENIAGDTEGQCQACRGGVALRDVDT